MTATVTAQRLADVYRPVLSADAGLAEEWHFERNPLGLWMMAVRPTAVDHHDMHFPWVGAVGLDRQNTIYRGVGEAVERTALIPRGGDGSRPFVAVKVTDLDVFDDGRTYPTTEISPDAVLYPPRPGHLAADSTPSGAASGLTYRNALCSALMELVERDALMRSWAGTLGRYVVPETAALEALAPFRRVLDRAVEMTGVRFHFVSIPLEIDAYCVVALAYRDGSSRLAAVGMKTSPDRRAAIVGATQESLQVFDCLKDFRAQLGPAGPHEAIRNDLDRARHWLRDDLIDHALKWFLTADDSPDGQMVGAGVQNDLCRAIVADGGVPWAVDLSDRLPERVRNLGWVAVKAWIENFQPLPMDETREDVFNTMRLGTSSTFPPHPLI